jgi:chorismate synthase
MKIEKDQAEILSGIRHGQTLGSPITLQIVNRDWKNWQEIMSPDKEALTTVELPARTGQLKDNPVEAGVELPKEIDQVVTKPRPGHADLSGAFKYRHHEDMRNVLERASARETAARVAVGAVAKALLASIGIAVISHVVNIGGVAAGSLLDYLGELGELSEWADDKSTELLHKIKQSPVFCLEEEKAKAMMAAIDRAKQEGDSLGGIVEVVVLNMPPGLGSYVHWDKKLDARIAYGLTSIQAVKAVEFGLGFDVASQPGSKVHDQIYHHCSKGFYRKTNGAGGIEGGMSNGEPIIVRAAMKPIPTLYQPLASVDIRTKEASLASVERSDICAVPACSVVAEAVVAWEIAQAVVEKFGGDNLAEITYSLANYRNWLKEV